MSVRLLRSPLSVAAAYAELTGPDSGGTALFVGSVRPDRVRAGRVYALVYDADRPMALAALRDLERSARRKFGLDRTVLWHRLGELPVGEIAVIVGASAGHRAAALRGCAALIERLKREVPIWKTDRARPGRPRRARPGRRPARSTGSRPAP